MSSNFDETRLDTIIDILPAQAEGAELVALFLTLLSVYNCTPHERLAVARCMLEEAHEALQSERKKG